MSSIVAIRGWFEVDFSEIEKIKFLIQSYHNNQSSLVDKDTLSSYLKGWVFQEDVLNGITHVFFGRHMKNTNSIVIEKLIKEIISTCEDVDGYFKFDNWEEMQSITWEIGSGEIREKYFTHEEK